MLKKKRKTDRPLLVTAMIVLAMVASVMVACQNDLSDKYDTDFNHSNVGKEIKGNIISYRNAKEYKS